MADGATWLLKHALEQGGDPPDVSALLAAGQAAQSWPAQLHVLQMLPRLSLDETTAASAYALALRALQSERPMLRAWGYAAVDQVGGHSAAFRKEAAQILAKARQIETAGSIRARLKRCVL